MAKYTIEQIKQWAERYKVLGSFSAVGKEFGIEKSIVGRKLKKYKEILNIQFKKEIKQQLLDQRKKQCYNCEEIKSIDMFNKSTHHSDGKEGICVECNKIYRKEHPQKKSLGRFESYTKYNNKQKEKRVGTKKCYMQRKIAHFVI